jgi:hypothetical protein
MTFLVLGISLVLLGMYVMPPSLKMITTYSGYAFTAYGLYCAMAGTATPRLAIMGPRGVSV